jgi:hypothetical protein
MNVIKNVLFARRFRVKRTAQQRSQRDFINSAFDETVTKATTDYLVNSGSVITVPKKCT